MSIQILPPQLANQIAAGEVVERPASVVKELVENSLDAGAKKVEIEIEKGGQKRILIRDDGKGIVKDELALALSRHATSKISSLDDLEAIYSLGFRGEALASISSVSRLTLTSKPVEQPQAWSAIAEGLEMDVLVKPAAHPNGTSIEVLDLFFNTPARRKFLRADKTEFSHIEQLIRRIALSRPDVSFVLKHNNKVIRRYRGQSPDLAWQEKMAHRLGEVVSSSFVEQCHYATTKYDDVEISVWAKQPELCVGINPAQYAFVNGRMMRDKLLQHAIRQGYSDCLHAEQQPEYVVSVVLPAKDVDVNVHPAKHEVRFHHARLVHDLLVRCIQEAVEQFYQMLPVADSNVEPLTDGRNVEFSAASSQSLSSLKSDLTSFEQSSINKDEQATNGTEENLPIRSKMAHQTASASKVSGGNTPFSRQLDNAVKVSNQQRQAFDNFASSVDEIAKHTNHSDSFESSRFEVKETAIISNASVGQADTKKLSLCFIEQPYYIYFSYLNKMYLLDMRTILAKLLPVEIDLSPAPLLVPVRLKLSDEELNWSARHQNLLQENGFDLKLHGAYVIIKQVPSMLRSKNVGQTLPKVFEQLLEVDHIDYGRLIEVLSYATTPQLSNKQLAEQFHILATSSESQQKLVENSVALNAKSLLANIGAK